jgi:hypothetical protein
VVVALKRQEP